MKLDDIETIRELAAKGRPESVPVALLHGESPEFYSVRRLG